MGKHWFVVRTATRRERRAVETMTEMGWVEPREGMLVGEKARPVIYMPVETRWHRLRDTKERIRRPLFPGYLFVQLTPADFSRLHDADGVHDVICAHDHAGQPIPDRYLGAALAKLRTLEAAGEFDKTTRDGADLKAGDAVRMVRGHFLGYVGTVKHMKAGDRRLTVTLGKMGDMRVDATYVEAV